MDTDVGGGEDAVKRLHERHLKESSLGIGNHDDGPFAEDDVEKSEWSRIATRNRRLARQFASSMHWDSCRCSRYS